MTNSYPRESVEFVPVLVTLDNNTITNGIEFSVTLPSARPTDSSWFAATLLAGETGFLTGTYTPGTWKVWARVTDSPEIPVIDCGAFQIS